MNLRSLLFASFAAFAFLCSSDAQTKTSTPSKSSSKSQPNGKIDVIVRVDAYDWSLDLLPESFGRQFDTLIVRVETVRSGAVYDPWVRVDSMGSNRKDRLPEQIFEPGHRWEMHLSPMGISEKNYSYCRPREAGTVKEVDSDGNVLDEISAIKAVSTTGDDLPDISKLKCYALRLEDLHEVADSP